MRKSIIISLGIIFFIVFPGCNSPASIDITPHKADPQADIFYQKALALLDYYDKDSTRKCLDYLDKALTTDSLNPDYYGLKSKLFSELGLLDSALIIQSFADSIGAITGEYLFQLALFQQAKGFPEEAHKNFQRSNDYLKAVLEKYPDSLGAFILQQAANSLYVGNDSLFMSDVKGIRKRFPDRLMEIEMTRRVKPGNLIRQIQQIEQNSLQDLASSIDHLLEENRKAE